MQNILSPWLLFANISVLGTLSWALCFKFAGDDIGAFGYMLILALTQFLAVSIGILLAKYGFGVELLGTTRPRGVAIAAIAGLSVIMCDVGLYYAFRHGSPTATNTYCSVAGIIAFAMCSLILFKDTLTVTKGIGILLGLVSLVLVAL